MHFRMAGLSPKSFLPLYGFTVPAPMRVRKLSLRAFTVERAVAAAALVDGRDLESELEKLFARSDVAYIHAHYASPTCYAARIERV